MKKFVFGLVLGLVLSSSITYAQRFMMGWTVRVETDEGLTVTCDDPVMWPAIKEIECNGGELE